MRRFEFVEGTSSKFWEIWVSGTEVSTRWGRIGTDGQTKAKDSGTAAAAAADMAKQITGKTKKGYAEVAAAGAPPPSPAPKPTAAAAPAPAPAPAPKAAPVAASAPAAPAAPAAEIPDGGSDPLVGLEPWFLQNQAVIGDTRASGRVGARPATSSHAWKRASKARTKGWNGTGAEHVAAVASMTKGKPPSEITVQRAATLIAISHYETEAVVDWLWGVLEPIEVVQACLAAEELDSPYSKGTYVTETYPTQVPLDRRTSFSSGVGFPWAWYRLSQHIAAMEPAARAEAEAAAVAAVEGGQLPMRAGVGIAFRNAALAREVLGQAANRRGMGGLVSSLDAPEAIAEWAQKVAKGADWRGDEIRQICAGLVEARELEAHDAILGLIPHVEHHPDVCFRALTSFASVEVARAMIPLLAEKETSTLAQRYLSDNPEHAIVALADVATEGGKDLPSSIFGSLVRDDPDRARRRTRGAARQLVESLVANTVASAPLESLPALFQNPPWRDAKAATSGVDDVLEIEPIAVPDTLDGAPVAHLGSMPAGIVPNAHSWGGRFLVADRSKYQPCRWDVAPTTWLWISPDSVLGLDALDQPDTRTGLKPWTGENFFSAGYPVYASVELGWFLADSLRRQKTARTWVPSALGRMPRHALAALLPIALGKQARTHRDAAQAAIRTFAAANGFAEALAEYPADVQDAVARILDVDPLLDVPSKPKPRPAWLDIGALPPIRLRDSALALPIEAVDVVIDMLSFSLTDEPYAGIERLKALCEPRSLAAFAWELFERWLATGGVGKEDWCLLAVGFLGDDPSALALAPKIRIWPGESAHARAVKGLDVLGMIGTDTALMQLHGISEKVKFRALKERAGERIAQIAEDRGMTPEELGDRLVPELDLDPDGSRILDFGPRQFRVGFDEQLKPNVSELGGKPRSDLPKPNSKDDAALAEDAVDTWKLLKKNVRVIAASQVARLERAMCAQRRWAPADFQRFLIDHPLIVHLSRRLVWGHWVDGTLTATFRVSEDRSLADVEDEPFALPTTGQIGLPHALELDNAGAWGEVFADYELMQPFDQLARPALALEPAETTAPDLGRVNGKVVPWGRVKNLEKRGWISGTPQDAGCIWEYHKPIGEGLQANLDLSPGLFAGAADYNEDQTLGKITLTDGSWRGKHKGWGKVSAVQISELLLDLQVLTAST